MELTSGEQVAGRDPTSGQVESGLSTLLVETTPASLNHTLRVHSNSDSESN